MLTFLPLNFPSAPLTRLLRCAAISASLEIGACKGACNESILLAGKRIVTSSIVTKSQNQSLRAARSKWSMSEESEVLSTFSYDSDEEASSHTFYLSRLAEAVRNLIGLQDCKLLKLAEGGYHKVYDVSANNASSLVVRVAAPAFPKDKVESEIATLQCIASHTKIHTPHVYAWNTADDNPVGSEYMILEKVAGTPASDVWDTLSFEKKEVVVSEVAEHIIQLFHLRFKTAGSLYRTAGLNQDFTVGPIISVPFYRALDGFVRFPHSPISDPGIMKFRGPFSDTSSYLQSFLKVELHIICDQHLRQLVLEQELNGDESRLEHGTRVLQKALQLASVYPGDICVSSPLSTPKQPFSLRMDDFRLSNIMIDENTGHITGLIDFEGATISPLWECAYMPRWLQDPEEWDGTHEGGTPSEKSSLRKVFFDKIKQIDKDGEWKRAHDHGRPFREFTNMLNFNVNVWADSSIERWVDARLQWAYEHPGEGLISI
ncbi:hypothetical protein DFH05DRAFT_1497352 [Lentinula detonsa]|uniref:Aminoglycoside phosphotransferase domain-containing protein n=1 Tax=Lentinula detonsa TaxID=2804962 RepID=A0A9W8NZ74_9AGAR|nr:hypothetical protein DFH05DRAFT_1497352 [Lentinula detonsa]